LLNDRPLAYQYYQDFLDNWDEADPDQAEIPEAEQYLVLNPDQEDQLSAFVPTPLLMSGMEQRLSISQCLPTDMQAMN